MGRLSPACNKQDIWNIIGLLLRTRAAIHRSIHLRYSYCHHFDEMLKSEQLRTLLESYNLTQHVHSPTHQTGHILDLVVSQTDDNFITSVTLHPGSLSDHHRIELKLRALKPAVQTNLIT